MFQSMGFSCTVPILNIKALSACSLFLLVLMYVTYTCFLLQEGEERERKD